MKGLRGRLDELELELERAKRESRGDRYELIWEL